MSRTPEIPKSRSIPRPCRRPNLSVVGVTTVCGSSTMTSQMPSEPMNNTLCVFAGCPECNLNDAVGVQQSTSVALVKALELSPFDEANAFKHAHGAIED